MRLASFYFISLLVLELIFATEAWSQDRQTGYEQYYIEQAKRITPGHTAHGRPILNTPSHNVQNQRLLKQPSLTQSNFNKAVKGSLVPPRQANSLCQDTSFSRLIGIYNGMLYVQSVTQLSDGGSLVPLIMYDTTWRPNPYLKQYGALVKLSSDGNPIWVKQFDELSPGAYSGFTMDRAFELSNGDIICAGTVTNSGSAIAYKTMVYRLTSTGNIIWKHCLQNTIGIFNSPPGNLTYWIESATDGLNGDVILCGTSSSNLSYGKIATVMRLNNLGQLIWDANYGNHGADGSYLLGAEGVSAFVRNGRIMLVGISHGNSLGISPAVNCLTLDYANGNLISKRFFRPDYVDPTVRFNKSFTKWGNHFKVLSNGHFLFYGKLFSSFINTATVKDHFGVIEFDSSFNLLNSYTLSSVVSTSYYVNNLHFDASGKGIITLTEPIANYNANVYFATFQNQQFQKQRKANYINVGMPGGNGFAFLPSNGYAFIQTYFQSGLSTRSYMEFRKMHESDTASQCLGKDSMFAEFSSLKIIEDSAYSLLDPNEPNKLVSIAYNTGETDALSTSTLNPCKQINYCDTVKIHGNFNICNASTPITFTAYKNKACGSIVQWDIDRSAIDSLHVLNDSSMTVWFKNKNWQGMLYAFVPAGACNVSGRDSVTISVTRSQVQVDIGTDTSLCPGNKILLNARSGYTTYLWQDGSTDSTHMASNPGIYHVTTSDACGNIFKDSVKVSAAPPMPFDVGADRTKCNRDTLHLTAPAGFLNYSWSNNYNISSTTGRNVVVSPLVDTAYYVKAEKTPGCFAYDTLHITVHHSPLINLGNDKSFCFRDSSIFDAGIGFANYAWSTTALSQQITVKSAGQYSVIGTTTEGCKSYDTVKVMNVYALPLVTLDKEPALCVGESKTLDAGRFTSYLWNTGSRSQTIKVSDLDMYTVSVIDSNGCKGSDTTYITSFYPLPAGFLPLDTSICTYGRIELKPLSSFNHYLWNTGSNSPSIAIIKPGLYWLEVQDRNDCKGRDSVVVNPKECMKGFYMPTAFTPNGDRKNDDIKPMLFGKLEKYSFSIYNRWGEIIFNSKDPLKGWGGKITGIAQPTGVFVWTCVYQMEGEKERVEKGTLTLMR